MMFSTVRTVHLLHTVSGSCAFLIVGSGGCAGIDKVRDFSFPSAASRSFCMICCQAVRFSFRLGTFTIRHHQRVTQAALLAARPKIRMQQKDNSLPLYTSTYGYCVVQQRYPCSYVLVLMYVPYCNINQRTIRGRDI